MVRYLGFSVLLFLFCTQVHGQARSLLEVRRDNAMAPLREFRDTLFLKARKPAEDSVLRIAVQLINVTRTQDDTAQLSSIKVYFKTAMDNYKVADADGKASIISNLSRDLDLKVHARAADQLGIENYERLFNDAKVNVLADINGIKQTTGKYTLFWATFTGVDQTKIISSGVHDGNSSNSANPYALVIKLPGYITFWMQETTSGKIYRSNPDYLMFNNSNDQSIEVNFVPR